MENQRPALGFLLALLATATWGTLPIAAQQVLKFIDAPTLVWIRFTVAASVLLFFLAAAGKLPKRQDFSWRTFRLLLLGVAGISANFVLIAQGLHYISPTTTQVLWQLSPFTMIFVGVVVFKDRMTAAQKIGLVLLLIGLFMFFNDKLGELSGLGTYAQGVLLCAAGSTVWVCYGVAQKLLSVQFSSQQILMLIYAASAAVLLPFAEPANIGGLKGVAAWSFFAYCCMNTLIGYGSFGEALKHWEASKVSVVTTLIPVFTMMFSILGHHLMPDIFSAPDMNGLAYAGAFVVVGGAVMAAVGDRLFKYR